MNQERLEALKEAQLKEAENARQREYNRLYDLGNIPKALREVSLAAIEGTPHKEKIISWMKRVLVKRLEGETEDGLYLYGPYGSGKTSLAVGLAMWATRNKMYSYFVKYIDLYEIMRDNPEWHEESESGVWDRLKVTPLVVIDDLFRHKDDRTGKMNLVALERLIEARMEDPDLITIFTANHALEEYEGTEQERAATLIMQCSYLLKISGVNFRKMMQKHRKEL